MSSRIAIALLPFGCLQPPAAPANAVPSSVFTDASKAARACDTVRARQSIERAEAACGDCTPWHRITLEQARVELALMNGAAREPTLAASARVATELERTDPVVAASFFAWLGRWRAPEFLERAAQTLGSTKPSAPPDFRAFLSVLLTDPEFTTHDPFGRAWPERHELQNYHWQAADSSFTRDDRYDLGACQSSATRMGRIPGFERELSARYVEYGACVARSHAKAVPGASVAASASLRLMTDPTGAVSRLDIHAAMLPAARVQCLGDTLRDHRWPSTPHGAIEEANIYHAPH